MAYSSYTATPVVARTYRGYASNPTVLRSAVLLAGVSAGASADTGALTVISVKRTEVRILGTAGWLAISPITGYYSTNQHPAGTSIVIPQTTHGLRAIRGLMVTIHNEATGAQEVADVTVTTGGNVTVTFVASAAANSKRITIIGPVL